MGFLGEPARCVEPVDAGPAALVGVDVRLPAVDDADAVDLVQIAHRVLRRRDDVLRAIAVASVGLDGEPVVGSFDALDGRLVTLTAGSVGLFFGQVEELSGVDAGGEAGDVLEVGVAPENRLTESTTSVSSPWRAVNTAAERPATPPPMTTTSDGLVAVIVQMSPLMMSATR